MLRQVLASSRYIMIIAVIGTFLGSMALILYEILALLSIFIDTIRAGNVSAKAVKVFAVGMVEAVDVFLIAIAVYIISIGLYSLFIDDKLPLPKWLEVHNLEDLKGNLVSVVIAVLAVLFLREAEGPAAGDQYLVMEKKARGLKTLPAAVAALEPLLAARRAGQYPGGVRDYAGQLTV